MSDPCHVTGFIHRYRLQDAPADYLPCLIGANIKLGTVNPTLVSYFETSTDYDMRRITAMIGTKWKADGSKQFNPILQCRADRTTFYIPALDLIEEAQKAGLNELVRLATTLLNSF